MPIYKVGERVFKIGDIHSDEKTIMNITRILDLGIKFIPNFFNDKYDSFFNLFFNFSNDVIDLNTKLFFYKPSREDFGTLLEENSGDPYLQFSRFCKRENFKNTNIKIPIISESLHFQIESLINIAKTYSIKSCNLSEDNIYSLRKFHQEKPFIVLQCDKNIGSAIISHENYKTICEQLLSDNSTYIPIINDPLEDTNNLITSVLSDLYFNNHIIKKDIYNNLLPFGSKLGTFKPIPKLHKKQFGNRPLINSIRHPTSRISLFLNFLLQPYVRNMKSFLLDSQNLLQKCNNLTIPSDSVLISADFESLYTNIDHVHATEVITEFMKDKLSNKHLTPFGFKTLLELVLENNYFTCMRKFFRQIKGVAMGTNVGPSIANIYIYILETKWLSIHNPFLYSRFIDDLFLIIIRSQLLAILNSLKIAFRNLKLNIEYGESVNFLDLNIKINKVDNNLNFSLYTKPTNPFSFLLTSSNHPKHIFKNIPKSLFIRVRRNSNLLVDYLLHARILTFRLMSRGYNFSSLRKISNMVANLDRDELLKYKSKANNFNSLEKNTFLFKNTFDINNTTTSKAISKAFIDTISIKKEFENTKLKFINKLQPNIGSILIHKFEVPIFYKSFCFPCKLDCNLCNFVIKSDRIKINDTFT